MARHSINGIPSPAAGRGKRAVRRLIKLGLISGAAIGLLWGGWALASRGVGAWIGGTRWAELRSIKVIGAKRLIEADVIRAAAVPRKANVMKVDLAAVAVKVETLPGVRSARAFRRMPGRLVIEVEERIPVAALAQGAVALVDDEGAVFPQVHVSEQIDEPLLTGDVAPGSDGFKRALSCLLRLRKEHPTVFANLGEIHVADKTLTMRLRQGGGLITAANPTDKAALETLELFLTQKGADLPADLKYVDLRYPSMVITGEK